MCRAQDIFVSVLQKFPALCGIRRRRNKRFLLFLYCSVLQIIFLLPKIFVFVLIQFSALRINFPFSYFRKFCHLDVIEPVIMLVNWSWVLSFTVCLGLLSPMLLFEWLFLCFRSQVPSSSRSLYVDSQSSLRIHCRSLRNTLAECETVPTIRELIWSVLRSRMNFAQFRLEN